MLEYWEPKPGWLKRQSENVDRWTEAQLKAYLESGKYVTGLDFADTRSRDYSGKVLVDMDAKKEPQKVIDLGCKEVLAGYFVDDLGIRHYFGNAEHIYQLMLTEKDVQWLKSIKIGEQE